MRKKIESNSFSINGVASSYYNPRLQTIQSNSKMSFSHIRNERLIELSKMVVNGEITYKIDHIATIYINGRHYFNMFRRYNSPYNIVIEDNNTDIHLHQDHTIRESLQNVLCLPDWETDNIYTLNATSYKHNGPLPCSSYDIADMRWSEVHTQYYAINVNFGGIFNDESMFVPPSTPITQIQSGLLTPLDAPERPPKMELDSAYTLLSLSIPAVEFPFDLRECDGPTLSMCFADVQKRATEHIICYCHMDEDDETEYDEDDENNFTILRSGTQIPKPFTQ